MNKNIAFFIAAVVVAVGLAIGLHSCLQHSTTLSEIKEAIANLANDKDNPEAVNKAVRTFKEDDIKFWFQEMIEVYNSTESNLQKRNIMKVLGKKAFLIAGEYRDKTIALLEGAFADADETNAMTAIEVITRDYKNESSAEKLRLIIRGGDQRIGVKMAALEGAPDGLEGEGRDIFRSRLWFNLYLGTGVADPGPAIAASGDLGPYARGAFALEAVRLLAATEGVARTQIPQLVTDIWRGDVPPPTGAALPIRERHGRYNSPIPAPHELESSRIPVYGGGMRLVGSGLDEDLTIAMLEGLYFQPDTPADIFLPYVDDPRQRVRWTAARLFRLCSPRQVVMEQELKTLLEHADAGVRWNAADALEHETWKRTPGGYR